MQNQFENVICVVLGSQCVTVKWVEDGAWTQFPSHDVGCVAASPHDSAASGQGPKHQQTSQLVVEDKLMRNVAPQAGRRQY